MKILRTLACAATLICSSPAFANLAEPAPGKINDPLRPQPDSAGDKNARIAKPTCVIPIQIDIGANKRVITTAAPAPACN